MTLIVSSHILSELDEYCTHILAFAMAASKAMRRCRTRTTSRPAAQAQTAQQPQLYALEVCHGAERQALKPACARPC